MHLHGIDDLIGFNTHRLFCCWVLNSKQVLNVQYFDDAQSRLQKKDFIETRLENHPHHLQSVDQRKVVVVKYVYIASEPTVRCDSAFALKGNKGNNYYADIPRYFRECNVIIERMRAFFMPELINDYDYIL